MGRLFPLLFAATSLNAAISLVHAAIVTLSHSDSVTILDIIMAVEVFFFCSLNLP